MANLCVGAALWLRDEYLADSALTSRLALRLSLIPPFSVSHPSNILLDSDANHKLMQSFGF